MKHLFVWIPILSLCFVCQGQAQGTIQFSCRIEGFEQTRGGLRPVTGFGSLAVNGNLLSYAIQVPNLMNFPAETHFHADGTDLRTSLANYMVAPPSGTWPGGITYYGNMVVTERMSQLLAGSWYVQMHSPMYVDGVIRGYVVPVPEPRVSTLAVLALICAGMGCAIHRWRHALSR